MKKINTLIILFFIGISSCKKDNSNPIVTPPVVNPPDTSTIKGAAPFTVGVAIGYDLMKNNSTYSGIVKNQFDRVTFEYQMKHQPNVQNNGNFDFTRTDELVALAQTASVDIHGHTLVWHQNNNGTYLRSLTAGSGPNLVPNPGFENDFTNWFTQVSGTAPTAGAISIVTSGAQSGSKAAHVVVTTPGPNAYSIQIVNDNFTVTAGSSYTLRYWAKAATAGQSLRAIAQGTTYYEQLNQTLTTSWAEYTFPFTPTETSIGIKFHFPNAGDFLIDNLSVFTPGTTLNSVLVNNALQNWITTMVTRYKGKVKSWDVANEVFADDGNLRTGTSAGDLFYWYPVLGRSYIAKAFTKANQADPDAVLFLNDYNLELTNTVKLDSFVKMVNELKGQAVPIHGVGTQMHININTPNSAIDNMFTKLAATGLKVHVSELDIRINPANTTPFTATSTLLDLQAQKYKYVAESYKRLVPAAQRFGITIWNVGDADSWIVVSGSQDAPTLFDNTYNKKPAFNAFVTGLKQ